MEHKKFKDKVYSYLVGDLRGRDLEEFEIHYFNCLDCSEYLLMNRLALQRIKEFISSSDLSELEDTLAINSILNDINLKIPISLKDKIHFFLSSIKGLTTDRSLPIMIYSLDTTRGEGQKANVCKAGEAVIIQIEGPRDWNDGYLTVLHYDGEDNLTMIFPKKSSDNTFLRSGDMIRIVFKVTTPKGKHYLKALLTSRKWIRPDEIDFSDTVQIAYAIERSIDAINKSDKNSWMETFMEFEVI
jgi:hypothetical protein